MKNTILFFVSAIVVLAVYLTSSSSASIGMSVVTLLLGLLLVLLFGRKNNRTEMTTALLAAFIVVTLATIVQYLSYTANFSSFASEYNDNYKFWITSQEGITAESLYQLYNDCIIQNIHYENGGYYLYIKSLAYLATKFADGNHLLLQQLGTAMPCIFSSIVVYAILLPFSPQRKVLNYTLLFIIFSPLILHSVGVHRDSVIAFLYFIVIYLWLCKDFNFKIGILQIAIAVLLYYFREQHGLFALSFVVLSAVSSHKRKRWYYVVAIIVLVAIVGSSYLISLIQSNYEATNEYYTNRLSNALSGFDSGIGRYVYMLPTPLRQIAQIVFINLRFPPWLALSSATSFYAGAIGILSLAVAVVWFYVFSFSLVAMHNAGFKVLPTKIVYGLILLVIFLFLNSNNMDSRRVVCMFPLLYVTFVYYREMIQFKIIGHRHFTRKYAFSYLIVCVAYLVVKTIAG